MDMVPITEVVRLSHVLVVAFGLGAALLADLHVLRRLGQPVDDELLATLRSCHGLVWKALLAMWITGAMMIYIRTGFAWEDFSPKLISKLITVAILTVNALLIGKFAMPLLEVCRDRSLMWLPLPHKLVLALLAALSTSSWMLALAMGVSKVLAASSWPVFVAMLPVVYLGSALFAMLVTYLLHLGSRMGFHRPRKLADLPAGADGGSTIGSQR